MRTHFSRLRRRRRRRHRSSSSPSPKTRGSQARQLPLPVHFPVKVLHHGVPVALVLHRLEVEGRVALVGGAELVVADGFVVGDFAPFGGADVVLGVDEGVADEADVGHDAHEFFGWHRGPDVSVYLGVVDHEGWCEYGSESHPVFVVIAVAPFKGDF